MKKIVLWTTKIIEHFKEQVETVTQRKKYSKKTTSVVGIDSPGTPTWLIPPKNNSAQKYLILSSTRSILKNWKKLSTVPLRNFLCYHPQKIVLKQKTNFPSKQRIPYNYQKKEFPIKKFIILAQKSLISYVFGIRLLPFHV